MPVVPLMIAALGSFVLLLAKQSMPEMPDMFLFIGIVLMLGFGVIMSIER
jgi:hypothetical protein